jgi:eukaryotic-like serine/threonine-protein kinase
MEEIKLLIDEEGHKHFIEKKLGQGGQGAVYTTKDKNIVIKVVLDETGNIVKNEKKYNEYKNNIDEIRILNLSKKINVAKPILMLEKPYNGYIMRLVSDMMPIKKIMIPEKEEGLSEFYKKTGGLERRLKVLKNLASILLKLHSQSIVYADISPENIFISSDLDYNEVWLIDADNMRYQIDFTKPIYTPGYGATEIVKGISSNNTYSDIYSFALLAYELLTTISPFEGELVINGGEDSWDSEDLDNEETSEDYYMKAEKGDVPWVNDLEDDRNFTEKGIPSEIVISKNIMELFHKTFSEEGRKSSNERPSMREWYDVLAKASNALIKCKECGNSFYIGNNSCPFCDTVRENIYYAQIYDILNLDEIFNEINNAEINEKFKLKEDDIEKLRIKKLGFKVIDKNINYFYNEEVKNTTFEEENDNSIEITIKQNCFTIKNLIEIEINIYEGADMSESMKLIKVLKKNEYIDIKELKNTTITLNVDSSKERRIQFKQI